jgi:hypothetical protein
MTPRPFYRWKSFWLGVSGLVFLLSAWAFSMGHRTLVGFGYDRAWTVSQVQGEVLVCWSSQGWPDRMHFYTRVNEMSPEALRAHKDEVVAASRIYGQFRCVVIPHWLVILLFVGLWLGFLAWRWRRMKLSAG